MNNNEFKALNMEFRGINQIDSKVLEHLFQLMSQDLNTRKYEAEAAHEKAKEERQAAEAGIRKAQEEHQTAEAGIQKAQEERQAAEAGIRKAQEERQAAEAGIRKAQEEQKVVEAGIQKAVEERMAAQARCEAIIRKAEAVKAVKALGKKRGREEIAESSIKRANMERPLLGPDCFLSGGCPQMIKFNKTANLTVQCCEVSNPQTLLKTQSGWSAWWNTHQLTNVRCHSAPLCTRVAIRGTGEIDMELFGCGSSLMTYCSWFVNL